MKNKTRDHHSPNYRPLLTCLAIIAAPWLISCNEPVTGKAQTSSPQSTLRLHEGDERYYQVNTRESVIGWKGSSLMGTNDHNGYLYPSKGELKIEKGELTGGVIEIDMNSMEDKDHKSDNKLIAHLKNTDFFDVEKFPFSKMTITRVTPASGQDKQVTGDLTIKGITHPVTLPAHVDVNDKLVKATGTFVIDRSKWDVRYKSQKFYDLVAKQAISDSIWYQIRIVAKK